MNTLILAAISGQAILSAVGWVVFIAVIAYILWWGLAKWAPGEPFDKLLRGLIVLFIVAGLIHVVLKLAGKPGLIAW